MRRKRASDYRFLFLALMAMALAAPLLGPALYDLGVLEISFGLVMISAVLGSGAPRRQRQLTLALGILAVGSMLASRWLHTGFQPLLEGALTAGFLLLTAWQVLRSVLSSSAINSREIAGVLSVYLLLGLAWAELYSLALTMNPAGLRFPEGAPVAVGGPGHPGGMGQAVVYYSFVTLTTLGYGDIVPVAPMVRTLAWMEALLGQLFLAVVVARLVSLYRGRGRGEDPGS